MVDPLLNQTVPTRRAAERVAILLGCSGAHQVDGGWLPCPSPAALQALISEGVAVYRQRFEPSEKGLISRAARQAKRVRLNPSAVDADGDGLVQDGTTAERPARGVARAAKAVAKASPPKVTRRNADEKRVDGHFTKLLDGVGEEIKKSGGMGRFRHVGEGPSPAVLSRKTEVAALVESEYGPTGSVKEIQAALEKAFPNAKVDLSSLIAEPADLENSAPKVTRPSGVSRLKADKQQVLEGLQGFSRAIMLKAKDDPETAALIGSINLTDSKGSSVATAGVSIANSASAPIALTFNPVFATNVVAAVDSPQSAYQQSQELLDDLKNRDAIKKSGQGNWSMGQMVHTNGDVQANAMWTGFHEWGHIKGLSLAHGERDGSVVAQLQDWVKTGTPDGIVDSFPELQAVDNRVRRSLEELQANKGMPEASKAYLEALGFKDVDISNQEQLRAVYRAVAVRHVLAQKLMADLEARTIAMEASSWKKMDTIGGYANIDPEEAVAEVLALAELVPDFAYDAYGDAYKLPQVRERI